MIPVVAGLLANKKLLLSVGGAIAVVTLLVTLRSNIYDAGYQAAVTDIQSQYNDKIKVAQQNYQLKVQAALNAQALEHQAELERVAAEQEIVVKTQEVIKHVDRIVEVPAVCDDLIDNVIGVLSEATAIVSGNASNDRTKSQNTGRTPNLLSETPTD